MVGKNPDTKLHCQVCGLRLPRRNHSGRRRELCHSHNSAVNCIVRIHRVSVERAISMVRKKYLQRKVEIKNVCVCA